MSVHRAQTKPSVSVISWRASRQEIMQVRAHTHLCVVGSTFGRCSVFGENG